MIKKFLSIFHNEYNRTVFISDSPLKYREIQDKLSRHGIKSKIHIEDRLNSRELPTKPLAKVQVKRDDFDLALKIINE